MEAREQKDRKPTGHEFPSWRCWKTEFRTLPLGLTWQDSLPGDLSADWRAVVRDLHAGLDRRDGNGGGNA